MDIALKDCPWCGGYAMIYIEGIRGYPGELFYEVKCTKCKATRPDGKFDTLSNSNDEAFNKAIKTWNRRGE